MDTSVMPHSTDLEVTIDTIWRGNIKEMLNKAIVKLNGMKKRYYVIFALLILFFTYNTITLRGFFYTENTPDHVFGFMDKHHGFTNAWGRSYKGFREMQGYVPEPKNIHDIENADEWYGSIFGTVVFMKWKWVGLHFGDHIILIDTWVPDGFNVADSQIFGHPYYILTRYDTVDNFSIESNRGRKIAKKWEQRFGERAERKETDKQKRLQRNINKYRRGTAIFYIATTVCIMAVILLALRRRKHRKFPDKIPPKRSPKERLQDFITSLMGRKKRDYIIFILVVVLFSYNIITFRGAYHVLNYDEAHFTFKGKNQCTSNLAGWTYDSITENKYMAEPYIAYEDNYRYHSILGTFVSVQGWIGFHTGNYMLLLNIHMPKGFTGKNNIFGHMFIVLRQRGSAGLQNAILLYSILAVGMFIIILSIAKQRKRSPKITSQKQK